MNTRLNKLAQFLKERGISNFLISSPSNIFYLTGFRGLAPWERECFLLITPEITYFITDTRYEQQVEKLPGVKICITEHGQNYYQKIVELLALSSKLQAPSSHISFEYRDLKYLEFEYLQRIGDLLVLEPQDGIIEELRVAKDQAEITTVERACEITDQVFDAVSKEQLMGKTEAEVSFLIETLSRKFGGEGTSFIPIVASGVNSSLSHHRPDKTIIAEGPLFIDFGVKYEGYTSDITRTLWISGVASSGTPRNDAFNHFTDTYQKILEAQQTAIEKIKPGMVGKEAYQIAYEVLKKYDLAQYFHHSLGHGVGIDIHENPRLSSLSTIELQPDMIFTVEPGVYIPGKFGIQIEDTVLLTKSGCQILTKSVK